MKNLKAKFCIFSLVVLLLLTGCANKGAVSQSTTESFNHGGVTNDNPPIEVIPITSVQDSFSEVSNALKASTFDNMSFEAACFTLPKVDKVHIFEYNITDFNISPDDAYDYMCKRLDELFPGMFGDEEKAEEIRFFDVGKVEEYPTLVQYKALEEKNYPYTLTNHPTTGINNESNICKECYLEMLNGVLWGYDNSNLAMRCEFNRNLNSFDILSNFPVIYRTENLESDKTFHLSSGDISIDEAVKSAEKCLSELELSERELSFKMRVQNVNVVDIGNGCCAFYFGFVPEYEGIKYNCILPDDTVFGFSTLDDNTNEREACGEAIMCEADKICRYRFLNPESVYDIVERSSSTSVVSLNKAAEITSEYLTAGINFNVLSVSSVYKTFSEIRYDQDIDYESYEKRKITIRPCWRFVLQPLTGNTNRIYYIFVDMLTGEPYRTVQLMESEVEYD